MKRMFVSPFVLMLFISSKSFGNISSVTGLRYLSEVHINTFEKFAEVIQDFDKGPDIENEAFYEARVNVFESNKRVKFTVNFSCMQPNFSFGSAVYDNSFFQSKNYFESVKQWTNKECKKVKVRIDLISDDYTVIRLSIKKLIKVS